MKKNAEKVCSVKKKYYLCIIKTSRSGAVVARWTHNPKVIGSNPFSATEEMKAQTNVWAFIIYYISSMTLS